ncbi:MAG: radical SAM family heme chaperone HemW, partial [Proteobacteria bacterium]|nr:radical SAM family heme chaperone HemW [Pseudomonadota bacterium]
MTGYSIYIHLPFCLAKCPYCDFFSTAMTPVPFAAYRKALICEWEHRRPLVDGLQLVSIYLGGGTPSLWPAEEIQALLEALNVSGSIEVTVEVNPGDAREDWFTLLKEAGVSRFSIGVQAVDDRRLEQLGRRHDRNQSEQAVRMAKYSGVSSVGADIIYGTPGQNPATLVEELRVLAALEVQHLSAYELTIAPDTPFGHLAKQGSFGVLEDEEMAALWHVVGDTLSDCGFHRYEVSNYARPGHLSLHNQHYWQGGCYIGLGAGAHGFVVHGGGTMHRYANGKNIADYVEILKETVISPRYYGLGAGSSLERISPLTYARERIMLGLRTEKGVFFSQIIEGLGPSVREQWGALVRELESSQMIQNESGWLRPTTEGML